MKAYGGRGGTAPLILILGAAWGLDGNITPQTALVRGKTPVPIEQETGWAPEQVCTLSEREFLVSVGFQTLDCPSRSLACSSYAIRLYEELANGRSILGKQQE